MTRTTTQAIQDAKKRAQGGGPVKYSYSGSDFNIWAYLPIDDLPAHKRPESNVMSLGTLQTITTSYASSVSSVDKVGSSLPTDFTRGMKTYAGSLIFTVLDKEPLLNLIQNIDIQGPDRDRASQYLTIDQMPLFNIVIQGTGELPSYGTGLPQSIIKVIIGVKLMTHGETISIDDFFLEQTYQYVARFVTPWTEVNGSVKEALREFKDYIIVPENRNIKIGKEDPTEYDILKMDVNALSNSKDIDFVV